MGCICGVKPIPEKIYWDDRKLSLGPNNNNSIIKLEFMVENIEIKNKYQIVFDFSGQNPFSTEEVLSQTPSITFSKCFLGNYFFGKQQNMNISLIKNGKKEGSLDTTLGKIVGYNESTFKGTINKNTNIIIKAKGISDNNYYVCCKFEAEYNTPNNSFKEAKDKIYYTIKSGGKDIYISGSIPSDGKFKEVRIPSVLLENGFTITFLDAYQDTLSFKDETIQRFCVPKKGVYLGVSVKNKNISIYNKSMLFKNVSFIDYIRSGVMLKLSIGIDYTSSNLPPSDPNSLHYLGNQMNDYEQAIHACGMIIAYYDYNQKFPVYGYGAMLKNEFQTNMCFNVNMKQNPEVYTLINVLKEYRNSFNFLQLSGPNNLCPLIQKTIDTIKSENNPLKYHVLLILTNGMVNDLTQTIDIIVAGSYLPLSIIIIGIGNANFDSMATLYGASTPMINSNGTKKLRDIVQFVHFNKYRNNPDMLAEKVLEEIPRQLIEYYSMNSLYPNNLKISKKLNESSFKADGYLVDETNVKNVIDEYLVLDINNKK